MKMFKHMLDKPYKKFKLPFTNLYIFQWAPLYSSHIHSHPNVNCNFFVLKGKLQENIYQQLNDDGYYMTNSKILEKHQSSFIKDDIGEHSIKNLSDKYSWTLHYYS